MAARLNELRFSSIVSSGDRSLFGDELNRPSEFEHRVRGALPDRLAPGYEEPPPRGLQRRAE
jgi:hypothetical protein